MSKELREKIVNALLGFEHDLNKLIPKIDEHFDNLTPPNAEDVCKALSVYFGEEVRYDIDELIFLFTDGNRKGGHITGRNKYHNTYAISSYALPPHLITMIGQFYESESE